MTKLLSKNLSWEIISSEVLSCIEKTIKLMMATAEKIALMNYFAVYSKS